MHNEIAQQAIDISLRRRDGCSRSPRSSRARPRCWWWTCRPGSWRPSAVAEIPDGARNRAQHQSAGGRVAARGRDHRLDRLDLWAGRGKGLDDLLQLHHHGRDVRPLPPRLQPRASPSMPSGANSTVRPDDLVVVEEPPDPVRRSVARIGDAAARARRRNGADRRHGDERLLRMHRARRRDAQLQDDHDLRRQRLAQRRRAQRDAVDLPPGLWRRALDRRGDRPDRRRRASNERCLHHPAGDHRHVRRGEFDALARLGGRHVDPGARRQRLRRGGRDGDHVADRRAASVRPRRRHAGHSLQRSRSRGARPLRPGHGAGRRDSCQVPRTRPHLDSGNRLSRGGDSGRVRRLDAAAARLRNDVRRAGAGAGDRLCRERLPGSAARDDVAAAAGRVLQGGMAEFGGGMAARRRAAEAGNAVSARPASPPPTSESSPRRRRPAAIASARSKPRATPSIAVSSPRRSTAS